MKNLKHRLKEQGFVANADYEYPVRCLVHAPLPHLRCLNIEGNSGRRKTAFAHALAGALDCQHILYHEYPQVAPPPAPVRIPPPPAAEDEPRGEPAVDTFDQILGEACALSEGDTTVLILDQLQRAPFYRHIQISDFVRTGRWTVAEMPLQANRHRLMVFLISEEALYHSIQQLSFRIWIASDDQPALRPSPAELGLGPQAEPVLRGLERLFTYLEVTPTWYEYQRLMHDIHVNMNSLDNLKTSIYGWIEGVERSQLYNATCHQIMATELGPLLANYLNIRLKDVPSD